MTSTWAPPPGKITWREVVDLQVARIETEVTQSWSALRREGDLVLYDLIESQLDASGETKIRDAYTVFYGRDGYGYYATADGVRWEPPEIVLPAEVVIGASWSASHRKGDRTIERSCELLASDLCEGGVVSVCDGVSGPARNIVREHFCPGVGWAGYEALHTREDRTERRWTEDLARDGVPLGIAPPPG